MFEPEGQSATDASHTPADPASAPSQTRRVRSAERVAAVLELLRRSPYPLRHAQVSRELGLPKSTATNLLDTLTDSGLVRRDSRGYSLGVKLIELGAAAADRLDIRAIARPVMRDLSELGIGTSNLAILQGHDVLYIEKLNNPDHVIQIATRIGGTAPAHATALGKVLVAAMDAAEQERWIAEHDFAPITDRTITSADEFRKALDFAALHGYALDDQEQNLRTVCVAAPVKDHTGQVVAAISLTCLSGDVSDGSDAQTQAIINGAGRVSALLGAT